MYSKALYVSLFLAGAHFGSASYDMYQESRGEIPPPDVLNSISTRTGGYRPTGTGTAPLGTGSSIRPTYTRTTSGNSGGIRTTSVYGGGVHTTSGYGGGVHTTSGYGGGIPTGVPAPGGNGGKCTMDSCGDLSAIGWQITCAQTADGIPTKQSQPTLTGGAYVPRPSGGYGYQMRRKRTGNQGGGHNRDQNDQNGPQNGNQPGAGSFDGRPICYKYIYDCNANDQEVSAPEQYPCYKAGDNGPGGQTWAYGTGNWPNPSATKNSNNQPFNAATTGVVQPNPPSRSTTTVAPGKQYTALAQPVDDY